MARIVAEGLEEACLRARHAGGEEKLEEYNNGSTGGQRASRKYA